MPRLTLTEVQRRLLEIIRDIESGLVTPEKAVTELTNLKAAASDAGVSFRAEYTLEDFQNVRKTQLSEYDESTESYVPSTSY